MQIIATYYYGVEIEDAARYRSSVFLQNNGRWKCLRCQRYRCEHVKFVEKQNPNLPPVPVTPVADGEILTY